MNTPSSFIRLSAHLGELEKTYEPICWFNLALLLSRPSSNNNYNKALLEQSRNTHSRCNKLSETLEINNDDAILRIGRALSSGTRLKVLKILLQGEKDVTRVARHLGGTEANASAQIKILKEADLLDCRYEPGQHGLKKISWTKIKRIIINLE
jgi:DNA-binding transcriptional ArsR family regulator